MPLVTKDPWRGTSGHVQPRRSGIPSSTLSKDSEGLSEQLGTRPSSSLLPTTAEGAAPAKGGKPPCGSARPGLLDLEAESQVRLIL